MIYTHLNIDGVKGLNQVILNKETGTFKQDQFVHSVYITNLNDTASCVVGLVLKSATDQSYIFKNIKIPVGVTLKLDSDDVSYNNITHDLYIKLKNRSDKVDIKIKTEI